MNRPKECHKWREAMKMFDNAGNLAAEQNVAFGKDGSVVISNTMYDNGKVVSQHVSVTDSQGNTRSEDFLRGKILP
jgi:hypothetical protein